MQYLKVKCITDLMRSALCLLVDLESKVCDLCDTPVPAVGTDGSNVLLGVFVRSTFPLLLPHPLAISGTIQQNCLTTANLNIRRTNCNFPERFLLKIGRVFTKILYIPIYSCVHYHQELTIGRTGGLLVALQSRGD